MDDLSYSHIFYQYHNHLFMTTQTIKLPGELSADVAQKYAQEWYNASPQKLANAFYRVNLDKGELYKVTAFQLSQAETMLLINSPETETLNVTMGMVYNKWVPMLQGQKEDTSQTKSLFENCFVPEVMEETPGLGKNNYTATVDFNVHLISPEFANIYADKWKKLTYGRMAQAFHNALESKRGEVKKRVRFYHFSQEVVKELKAMQPESLTVLMGCGDAESRQHPFGFRPVIKATRKYSSILFDFAQPCPPFCDV